MGFFLGLKASSRVCILLSVFIVKKRMSKIEFGNPKKEENNYILKYVELGKISRQTFFPKTLSFSVQKA